MGKSEVEESATKAMECPSCGEEKVAFSKKMEKFPYREGEATITLQAEISVGTCGNCGFAFTDHRADEIRHAAVCAHLGVLSPEKIAELRQTLGLSRADLARLTRIGEASIARWERGEVIQNAALDQLLFLLGFSDNLPRLKNRKAASAKSEALGAQFRTQIDEKQKEAAAGFQLRTPSGN